MRQLDAVAARFLLALARRGRLGPRRRRAASAAGTRCVDVDDTVIEVHGHAKQGAGFGYTRVRGLNALLATVTTADSAPLVVAQRLRKGALRLAPRRERLVADAVKQTRRLLGPDQPVLVRMDSAYYGRDAVHAAITGGAHVSVTVRVDHPGQGGDRHHRPRRVDHDRVPRRDPRREPPAPGSPGPRSPRSRSPRSPARTRPTRCPAGWSCAGSPTCNAEANKAAGQGTLFDLWRFHAFFTTAAPDMLDTVAADKTHRGHAIIEQVHADLKNSALAHLPSGKFTANAAWLVLAVIAFNLTRAAATLPRHPTWRRRPPRPSAAS